jgi:hypothetical protein
MSVSGTAGQSGKCSAAPDVRSPAGVDAAVGPLDVGALLDVGGSLDLGALLDVGGSLDLGALLDVGGSLDVGALLDVGGSPDVDAGPLGAGVVAGEFSVPAAELQPTRVSATRHTAESRVNRPRIARSLLAVLVASVDPTPPALRLRQSCPGPVR